MKKTLTGSLVVFALVVGAPDSKAQPSRGACSDVNVSFSRAEVDYAEESLTVPLSAASPLVVKAHRNGGIRAYGSTGSAYRVSLCKAAERGVVDLRSIAFDQRGNELSVTGPDGGGWTAFFVIEAPANAFLELTGANGPVSIDGISGRIKAEVKNGPLSVKSSRGEIQATTKNGPLSVKGSEGDIVLEAVNGPLSVALEGTSWNGRGLKASTKNGPLTLSLPEGFRSGVVIEASEHSPVACSICGPGFRKVKGEPQRIELGFGTPVVELRTVNGPVSVKAR